MFRSRQLLDADYAHQQGLSGRGIGIAFLDTGTSRHPDFDHRILAWKDFVRGRLLPYDDCGHGTHVAGIAAGNGSASRGMYKGIAPGSNIISLKILNQKGEGTLSHTMAALDWIIQHKALYNIRIVNISICSSEGKQYAESSVFVQKVDELWNLGLVVVAAAGNNGPGFNTVSAPGNSRKIITVGSHEIFYHSNNRQTQAGQGPTTNCIRKPDVVAPGSQIISCQSLDLGHHPAYYTKRSGTSMSTPMVSGAIALLLQKEPDLTPKKIKIRLKHASTDLHLPHSQQGWGLLSLSSFL